MLIARQPTCAAGITGHFYVASGSNGSPVSVMDAYVASAKSWTTLAPIPQAVVIPGFAAVSGRLYCFGGSNNGQIFQGNVFNSVQIYQP